MVFNCAALNWYEPMRFAGTWKQYSKKAIPQLARITFQSASLRNFRWPYHAKVMKMLEMVSNRTVRIGKDAPRKVLRYRPRMREDSLKLQFRQTVSAGFKGCGQAKGLECKRCYPLPCSRPANRPR